MNTLINKIFLAIFCIIPLLLTQCTADKQIEGSGSDNTGVLHHVRKKLYKRTDTKINLVEHAGHEDHLDTLTIIPEEIDTLIFKTPDVSLNLLAKDLNGEKAKFTRFAVKSRTKKYFFKTKSPVKLPKESYISAAFLCNSRGFSIKSRHSIKVYSFKIIDEKQPSIDKEEPMIFINRPCPTEKGGVALDFVLINASLSEDELLVRVKIDDVDFFVDKWIPFVIHGLKPGRHKIEVALIDKEDKELENYFSKDTREFILN